MKRKKVLCLLCAAAVMLTSIPFAPTRAYASQVNQEESQIGENQSGDATDNGGTEEPTENIWEDETGLYEVLEQDAQGRELVARSGNVYFTTEYDDANSTITQYCSEGPLEGNNYDRKTTGGRQMRSIFGMPSSDLAGGALRRVPLPSRSKSRKMSSTVPPSSPRKRRPARPSRNTTATTTSPGAWTKTGKPL